MARHKFDPKRALMVGDNLATDIEFGINSGVRTLLVLGGQSALNEYSMRR
jgi:4-nitrophenyl phosphatase